MRWTEADFDSMSWHDNHVYGLEIRRGEDGAGELVLRLDYILEWLGPEDGRFTFRMAPATLTFHGVFALRIELDYIGYAFTPFSIAGIGREGNRWTIGINWPEGIISFEATSFGQELIGAPVLSDQQSLH
jgi:hypothetical protein